MDIGNKHNEYKKSFYTNRWVQSDTLQVPHLLVQMENLHKQEG